MQTQIAAAAAVAAVLGCAYALLAAWRRSAWADTKAVSLGRLSLGAGTVIALLALVAFVARNRPFSPGSTLGWGLLIGGALGLYALFQAGAAATGEGWLANAVGLLSAASLGPSILLLLFRGYPNEALVGCAIGATFMAAIVAGALRSAGSPSDDPLRCSLIRGIEVFAVAAATVAVGARLGIDHFPRSSPAAVAGGYWAAPGLILAIGSLVLALISAASRERAFLYAALAGAVAAGATSALGVRLLPALFAIPPLFAWVTFGVALHALRNEEREASSPMPWPIPLTFGFILVALAINALAFRQLQGYGQALALIPALLFAAVSWLGEDGSREPLAGSLGMGAVTLALLMTIYRLYLERVPRGGALDFQGQYDLAAMLLGTCAGFIVVAVVNGQALWPERPDTREPAMPSSVMPSAPADLPGPSSGPIRAAGGASTVRIAALLAVLAGAPPALAALWGARTCGAFLVGLIAGEAGWMLLVAGSSRPDRRRALAAPPHLFLLGSALTAVQLTPFVMGLGLGRSGRLIVAGAGAALALVAIVAAGGSRSIGRGRTGA